MSFTEKMVIKMVRYKLSCFIQVKNINIANQPKYINMLLYMI